MLKKVTRKNFDSHESWSWYNPFYQYSSIPCANLMTIWELKLLALLKVRVSTLLNPILHRHRPLWPMIPKICLPCVQYFSQTHETSWHCSFWYFSKSSKPTFDISFFRKIWKIRFQKKFRGPWALGKNYLFYNIQN